MGDPLERGRVPDRDSSGLRRGARAGVAAAHPRHLRCGRTRCPASSTWATLAPSLSRGPGLSVAARRRLVREPPPPRPACLIAAHHLATSNRSSHKTAGCMRHRAGGVGRAYEPLPGQAPGRYQLLSRTGRRRRRSLRQGGELQTSAIRADRSSIGWRAPATTAVRLPGTRLTHADQRPISRAISFRLPVSRRPCCDSCASGRNAAVDGRNRRHLRQLSAGHRDDARRSRVRGEPARGEASAWRAACRPTAGCGRAHVSR